MGLSHYRERTALCVRRQVRNWFAWYLLKKSNILSVSEISLEMLRCAMTHSLGYNGDKEITFSL